MRSDPTKPMRTWRTAWRALTKSAGLSAFRFHDLRHHAITELAESRASDQTIMAIAGHLSARMLNHYSHVRLDIRRAALDTLSARRTSEIEGYVTKSVTKAESAVVLPPQPIENMVDVTGIEPVTPCLQSNPRNIMWLILLAFTYVM